MQDCVTLNYVIYAVMTTHAFLYCCVTEGMSLDIYYNTNGIQLLLKCKIMQMVHY